MNAYRLDLLLFFIITLLAEILGTLGGFGSSMFFVSFSQFLYDFKTVLALTGTLHIFSNISKLILFRKTIDYKVFLWLGVSSVLLAIAGAYLTSIFSFGYARILLGLFLVALSTLLYRTPHVFIPPTKTNSILSGSVAGFLAGFVGTGGAVRGLALTSFNMEKNFFVGTSAAIDFGVDLSRTLIYLDHDFLQAQYLLYIPLLMLAAWLGSYLGKLMLNRINQNLFQRIVLALILLTGMSMLVQEVLIRI